MRDSLGRPRLVSAPPNSPRQVLYGVALAVFGLAFLVFSYSFVLPDLDAALNGSESSADVTTVPIEGQQATRQEVRRLLSEVAVATRTTVPGYSRGCGQDEGCSFGPAWSDGTSAPLGRNGCDTRNDLLAKALESPEFRPGTNDCVVIAGEFLDPFTGERMTFRKGDAAEVQVDHIFALARGWDAGAANWTQQQRDRFANDPANLVVVSGPANASKGDDGPGEWLPVNASYRCTYVARYLAVADTYGLTITPDDAAATRAVLPRCRNAR